MFSYLLSDFFLLRSLAVTARQMALPPFYFRCCYSAMGYLNSSRYHASVAIHRSLHRGRSAVRYKSFGIFDQSGAIADCCGLQARLVGPQYSAGLRVQPAAQAGAAFYRAHLDGRSFAKTKNFGHEAYLYSRGGVLWRQQKFSAHQYAVGVSH